METPKLVVIQGQPGVGKTTLARRLSGDLELPWMGKDTLKEFMFDKVGMGDREWSKTLGRASISMLYELADEILRSGNNFMIESAFMAEFATDEITGLLKRHNAQGLELYCSTDDNTRIHRYHTRVQTGERHAGHVEQDGINLEAELRDPQGAVRYGRLNIGQLVEVDTTILDNLQYVRIKNRVHMFLARQ